MDWKSCSHTVKNFILAGGVSILAFAAYERTANSIDKKIADLHKKERNLQELIKSASLEQEELCMRLSSFKDPDSIELALIQELGLVPEGYTKFYFEEK